VRAAEWIGQAQPEAPERLVVRVREVLELNPRAKQLGVAEALLDAADALLVLVLRDGDEPARERALDLLAADACVTWAFEVAADNPDTLVERARKMMQRLEQVVA
jgi:hypothetical protein